MAEYTLLLIYVVVGLLLSFLCSLLEAVLLSATPSYAQMLAERGKPSGRILVRLKNDVDQALAAILTLNTLSHTISAAGAGGEAARIAADVYRFEDAAAQLFTGGAAAVITILILVLSEIIPKTIGASAWRPLAAPCAYITLWLIRLLKPAVLALEVISRFFRGRETRHAVSREELLTFVRLGHEGGDVRARESELISNVLKLREVKAKDVLTPRVETLMLRQDRTADDVVREYPRIRFSRIPVFGDNQDDVTGVVLRYRVFESIVRGRGSTTLRDLQQPVRFVPETTPVAGLLDQFITTNEQLFVVVNEFGGMEGIITLEDAVETLLGAEIVDELDTVDDLRRLARTRMDERRRRLAESQPADAGTPPASPEPPPNP